MYPFQARLQNSEKRLLASTRVSVCLSVLVEQLGSHWTEYHQTLYFSVFKKKTCQGNTRFIKISQKLQVFYMNTYVHLS